MTRLARAIVIAAVLTAPREVRADEVTGASCGKPDRACLRMRSETTLRADDGRERRLPAGRFVDEATWSDVDAEFRRLQDAETRLAAENKYMREKVGGWQPGWKTLAAALLTGVALGAYGYSKL